MFDGGDTCFKKTEKFFSLLRRSNLPTAVKDLDLCQLVILSMTTLTVSYLVKTQSVRYFAFDFFGVNIVSRHLWAEKL
jgi:hypothetical protein